MVVTTAVEWLVIPLISALIGYVTNVIAVRMLFRPRQPLHIWGLGTVQGLIPKRRHDLARAIGQVVENELLSVDVILDKLALSNYKGQALATVTQHVRTQIKERMPWFVPAALQDVLVDRLCELIDKEGESVFDALAGDLEKYVRENISIRDLVESKILAFDLAELEDLIVGVAHKELRYIEVLGMVLGCLIGVGQAGVLALLR